MSAQDKWQQWCDQFDQLHNGILRLFHDRAIWRTIMAMLDANPQVTRGGFGEHWLGSCYANSMLIGIRREAADDAQSIGLLRSLNKLAGRPQMASRAWFEQQIQQRHQERDAEKLGKLYAGFDVFAAPGQPFIDPARVHQDVSTLKAVIRRANDYTNKTIAHRHGDPSGLSPDLGVTWGELDGALDSLGTLYKKYYRLRHTGDVLGNLTPLISPAWIQMFETAWMPPDFIPPDNDSFEPAQPR